MNLRLSLARAGVAYSLFVMLAFLLLPAHAAAQSAPDQSVQPGSARQMSAPQLFDLAAAAEDDQDMLGAEKIYRALSEDPDLEIRTEARFRLAMLLADRLHHYQEAAVLFRRILDEKPGAARVRLELARMQAALGNPSAARRELRAAQAGGLPTNVAQLVRFYARALSARKPVGGSLEIGLAPDSNINRATRSDTLGTVLGNLTLNDKAKAKSGVGLNLQGQIYGRINVDAITDILVRASAASSLYPQSEYDDINLSVQGGPQFNWSGNQLAFYAGPGWRWYGPTLFTQTVGAGASWQKSTGKRTQLRIDLSFNRVDNKRNTLQSATDLAASVGVDRAVSARAGIGIQTFGLRELANDRGYSQTVLGTTMYGFREFGQTTLLLSFGYHHLGSDARLALYPKRREESKVSATLAGTLRALRVGSFAPVIRLKWERNSSTIAIYSFSRLAAEFGVTSAF